MAARTEALVGCEGREEDRGGDTGGGWIGEDRIGLGDRLRGWKWGDRRLGMGGRGRGIVGAG
jgi:hypothetical protein